MGRYETAFQLMLTPEQQTHLIDNGRPRDDRQLYVRVADNSVIAHHTIHHDPGPNACKVNGAIRPDSRMPDPGPA